MPVHPKGGDPAPGQLLCQLPGQPFRQHPVVGGLRGGAHRQGIPRLKFLLFGIQRQLCSPVHPWTELLELGTAPPDLRGRRALQVRQIHIDRTVLGCPVPSHVVPSAGETASVDGPDIAQQHGQPYEHHPGQQPPGHPLLPSVGPGPVQGDPGVQRPQQAAHTAHLTGDQHNDQAACGHPCQDPSRNCFQGIQQRCGGVCEGPDI